MAWDRTYEAGQRARVAIVCDGARPARERDTAWQQLISAIAPQIERWARDSRILRRCRLDGDDDVRAVMVAVLGRLAQRDFENLRRFLDHQPVAGDDVEEAELLEALARLARPDDDDDDADHDDGGDDGDHEDADDDADDRALVPGRGAPVSTADTDGDDRTQTPLRGWLVALTRFVGKDHVKRRLGWSSVAAAGAELAAEESRGRSKRDLTTDAAPLEHVPEAGARPPVTDAMTMRAILVEIRAYLRTLPPAMTAALELWLDDHDFGEIATELRLDDPGRARALVRAGQARLRDRFRDRWPELCAP